MKREEARHLDEIDVLARYRSEFYIPEVNGQPSVYLCGNSLGLQPRKAKEYVVQEMDDWARLGVEGHLHARHPWLPYHEFLTHGMANVVGARPDEVVVMNSLTVNVHLLLVSFYTPTNGRRKIVVESDIFPSDLYAVRSQIRFHGGDPDTDLIFWKPRPGEYTLRHDDLLEIIESHKNELALIFIGGVNYYTGQSFDLAAIAQAGHAHGITVGFDLAHGAGNIDYQLHDSGADFAAWCSYKYLNSSPGSLSAIFVHSRHHDRHDIPRFEGWWGHNKETRFGMRDPFDALPGAEAWQLSNPPILPLAVMRSSLELFEQAGMQNLRKKSVEMTNMLADMVFELDHPSIEIISPLNSAERGCQLSLLAKSNGKRVFDDLTNAGVIADWREPDVIRIAPVPLYNAFEDIFRFTELLQQSLARHA